MSWITPLGFLGLLGIVILILIYILKPNYQKKIISSTFVWKLSLKYKKKRFPINYFRNLLIFLCQVLIITSCAFILAQPFISADSANRQEEKILIIESSANMLAATGNETRFERAVWKAHGEAESLLSENGRVSVIIASDDPYIYLHRETADKLEDVLDQIKSLVEGRQSKCSYGVADVDGAMALAEVILAENDKCEVVFYTGTSYIDEGNVTVDPVSVKGEWNAAILDATAELEENFYTFNVDVACYGRSPELALYCEVHNYNGTGDTAELVRPVVRFEDGVTQTVSFNSANSDIAIYSFDSVSIYYKNLNDSFGTDNSFSIYGGTKEVIDIEYYSSVPNSFMSAILMSLRDSFTDLWDINITEIQTDDKKDDSETLKVTGYDIYIFEHKIPDILPTDGLVLLVNPTTIPFGAGLSVIGDRGGATYYCKSGPKHEITNGLDLSQIQVTRYKSIITEDDSYTPIMYCGDEPAFLIKNEVNSKIAVLSFSLNYSDFPMLFEFPIVMFNFFNYYFPATVSSNLLQVGDTLELNMRGKDMKVTYPGGEIVPDSYPAKVQLSVPGLYTVTQEVISGESVSNNVYVKIAASESNVKREYDTLTKPYVPKDDKTEDLDLLIYFASALVALLFIEWWLQSRDSV